jgi:hypothetical protein
MFEEDMVDQKKEEEEALMVKRNYIKTLNLATASLNLMFLFLFSLRRKENVVDYL